MYPRFTEMVESLEDYVRNNPKVLKALEEFSGLNKNEIFNRLKFGTGPTINIKDLNPEYGNFNGANNSNALNTDAAFVRGLEKAHLKGTVEATSFLLAVTVLHEFVHYGRLFKKMDRLYEYGIELENAAYGYLLIKIMQANIVGNFTKNQNEE